MAGVGVCKSTAATLRYRQPIARLALGWSTSVVVVVVVVIVLFFVFSQQ